MLITSNASTNFFIYCFVNNAFREELSRYWKTLIRRLGLDKAYNVAFSWHKSKPEVVVLEGDNISSIARIEMNNKEATLATNIQASSVECVEPLLEASYSANNIEPTKELECNEMCVLGEITNGKYKIRADCKNEEAIQTEESQSVKVATISVNDDSHKITKHPQNSEISPETVVKIYCDYDAVRL